MTSKEDLKKLKDAFLTIKQEWLEDSNVKLTEWQKNVFDSIKKDLEEYEGLKNLMGTPIQELMNKLKELETVKAFVLNYTAFYDNGCCLDEYIYYDSEIGTLFKKWNDE